MKSLVRLPAILFVTMTTSAVGQPSDETLRAVSESCRQAFLEQNVEEYIRSAAAMLSWGTDLDQQISDEVSVCLAFAGAIEGADLEEAQVQAQTLQEIAQAASSESGRLLAQFLERANEDDVDLAALVAEIAESDNFSPDESEERETLEGIIAAYVRPIPASQAELNLTAYRALWRINPGEERYAERIAQYEGAIEAEEARVEQVARQLEGRLIRNTAEFDGSSWSRHPSSPRFQDIRSYVTLYLLESGSGQQNMELFFNYTSRDGWLFVQSASINIDGDVSRVPAGGWSRDNDTEIWEYASVRGSRALALAREIAESDRAVVRFNGQQFYNDYVINDTDRRVLREMLAMWDVISE